MASAVSGEEAGLKGIPCPAMLQKSVQEQPEMRQQQAEKPTTPDSSEGSEDDAACEMESIPTDEDTAMLVSMFAEEARARKRGRMTRHLARWLRLFHRQERYQQRAMGKSVSRIKTLSNRNTVKQNLMLLILI